MGYFAVSKMLGISVADVRRAEAFCLDALRVEETGYTIRMRTLELARYEAVVSAMYARLDDEDGRVAAGAAKSMTGALSRIDKLLGLEAPEQHETKIYTDSGNLVLPREWTMKEIEEASKVWHEEQATKESLLLGDGDPQTGRE